VFAGAMILEMLCIAAQAARGTTSHFDYSTAVDAVIFQIMGIAITANTVAVAVLLRRDAPAARSGYLLGVRLGLALFVLGSVQGFLMVANMGHALPGPDGGPGLPFVNWASTEATSALRTSSVSMRSRRCLCWDSFWIRTR